MNVRTISGMYILLVMKHKSGTTESGKKEEDGLEEVAWTKS